MGMLEVYCNLFSGEIAYKVTFLACGFARIRAMLLNMTAYSSVKSNMKVCIAP